MTAGARPRRRPGWPRIGPPRRSPGQGRRAPLRAARELASHVPLRIRLVAAVLAMVALALALISFVGGAVFRNYLLDRADRQLAAFAHSMVDRRGPGPGFGRPGGGAGGTDPFRLSDLSYYGLITDAQGNPVEGSPGLQASNPDQTAPQLPTMTSATAQRLNTGRPFIVAATGGGHGWLVLVTPATGQLSTGATVPLTVTAAISLDDVDNALGRLAKIDLTISVVVLAFIGGLGYWVVRTSLRGLTEVERTTEAIAAGDLGQRVPLAGTRTEVGRLATAVNTMLSQIESGFTAQRASEQAARASEERMRRFVADASHELRTPLTSIRGFAELYRMGAVGDRAEVDRVMDRIEREATRMGLLVEDLLLLARLDQQRPLERRPVDLLAVATDIVGDAATINGDHPVRLEVATGDQAPPVVPGDEARLRQVLTNLVSNALTHTPPGTPVTVTVESAEAEVRLAVADRGPGLSPEAAARIFERFYRVDTARSRANGGSGLGLSIVAALVAAHGGTVEVDTAPGAGSRFLVRLPRGGAVDSPAALTPPASR